MLSRGGNTKPAHKMFNYNLGAAMNQSQDGSKEQRWYYQNLFGLPIGPCTLAELQIAIDRSELGLGMRIRAEHAAPGDWTLLDDLPKALGLRLSTAAPAAFAPRAWAQTQSQQQSQNQARWAWGITIGLALVASLGGYKYWHDQQVAKRELQTQEAVEQRLQIFKGAVNWLREYRSQVSLFRSDTGKCPTDLNPDFPFGKSGL
jgi:hypothetical protein